MISKNEEKTFHKTRTRQSENVQLPSPPKTVATADNEFSSSLQVRSFARWQTKAVCQSVAQGTDPAVQGMLVPFSWIHNVYHRVRNFTQNPTCSVGFRLQLGSYLSRRFVRLVDFRSLRTLIRLIRCLSRNRHRRIASSDTHSRKGPRKRSSVDG